MNISYNPTGQAIMNKSNRTLKEMLKEQKENMKAPKDSLDNAFLTLNF